MSIVKAVAFMHSKGWEYGWLWLSPHVNALTLQAALLYNQVCIYSFKRFKLKGEQ